MLECITIIYHLEKKNLHKYAVLNKNERDLNRKLLNLGVGVMVLPEETWLSDFTGLRWGRTLA